MQSVQVHKTSFASPLLRWLRGAWTGVCRELRYRRDIGHLSRLDDTALADLGLRRGGIEGAVRGQFDPHEAAHGAHSRQVSRQRE